MKKSNFKSDLSTGHQGELLLLKLWPELVHLDGRKADFITPDFQTLELKSEKRSMAETENFFIEHWSDYDKKKMGGPWQALGRGASLFAIMFLPDETCFVFNTHELVSVLEAMSGLKPVKIFNRGWITVGYKVPRKALEHLVVKVIQNKKEAI